MDNQKETPITTAMQGQQPTVLPQPTGQARQAPLLEGTSASDEAFDPGLTNSSSEDGDSELYSQPTILCKAAEEGAIALS